MTKVRGLLERIVNTAVYAFIGALPVALPLAPDALSAAGWAGLTATIAAVLSLVKNLMVEPAGTASANIIERFAWTAGQAFFAAVPATFALTVDDARAVALMGVNAAVSAVLSLAKNLAAEGAVVEATRRATGEGAHEPDMGGGYNPGGTGVVASSSVYGKLHGE